MRHSRLIAGLAVLGALAACQKEQDTAAVPAGPQEVTFRAAVGEMSEEPGTRTEISGQADGSATVLWKLGDAVSVFDAEGTNQPFLALSAGSTTILKGEAVQKEDGAYYAVYPYAAANAVAGTVLSASIPSEQVLEGPGFADAANAAVAKTSSDAFSFYNAGGLVRFTVPASMTTLKQVKVESVGGEAVSGDFTVDFSGTEPGTVTPAATALSAVTLKMKDDAVFPAGNYYAVVLPGTYTLKVTLTDQDGASVVKTAPQPYEIKSSHIRSIGSVKADTFYQDVEFVLGSAAVDGETAKTVYTGALPAGTYAVSMLFPDGYAHRGDKAIYDIGKDFSFTVAHGDGVQTIAVDKEGLAARHLLVRSGDNLQTVINAAEAGLDDIYVGAGTFTGNFTMKEGIDVTGSWNDDFSSTVTYEPLKSTDGLTTILDGNAAGRVVNQAAAFETVTTWKNVIIQKGAADKGSGAYLRANGILDGCEVVDCKGTSDGGGIFADLASAVTHCYVHGNAAGSGSAAGGIYIKGVVSYSIIDNNTAKGSGGAYVYSSGAKERPRIFNCRITNNKATGDNGGGVRLNAASNDPSVQPVPIAYNLYVAGNTCTGAHGSGILCNKGDVFNCTVVNNSTSNTSDNANAVYQASDYSSTFTASDGKEYTIYGRLQNCIVYGNYSAEKDASNATQIYVTGSKAGVRANSVGVDGSTYIQAQHQQSTQRTITDAFFNADYSLTSAADDYCKNGGSTDRLSGYWAILPKTDLAGNNRLTSAGKIGRGCYQYQQ